MTKKNKWGFRKIKWPYVLSLLTFALVAGYYAAAGASPDGTIFTWYRNMQPVLQEPFRNYWNEYSLTGIVAALCIYSLWFLYYLVSAKNYMKGKEFGTANFGEASGLNKKLADMNNSVKDEKNIVVEKKRLIRKPEQIIVNTRNRILSQNIQMTLDTRHTDLNNNILLFGGSGSGKTFRFVKPNLMQMVSSFVITDPKGEIMRDSAGFLKQHGYSIKVLNLLNATGMKKSTKYNPFRYIMNDTDIVKMVTTFMEATKKKGATSGDQFWEDMAGLLLQAIFFYVHDKGVEIDGRVHHDFKAVMQMVNMLKIEEDPQTGQRVKTEIDAMFARLEEEAPSHQAVLAYNKAMVGAADTVRSIISTVNSRTTCLQTEEILELLTDDEIEIKSIGVQKTAVYCIIPDNDKTYNFLVSILYQQMFQQLYYQADFVYGGRLPVHVTFLLDEFANVALPDDFCSLLSTMRSREISAVIIIQNMAQIKALFKDTWETIPGNCDTIIYLGGNEQSTHEYISKLLGKGTIDKQTQGLTRGKQGSSSSNEDVLGRELMLPDEVRKMSRKECLIIINGQDPVLDRKIQTPKHPLWKEFNRFSRQYEFDGRLERLGTGNILLKGGDGVSDIKVIEKTKVDVLRAEDERNRKEYEKEKRIAQLTGGKLPETPEKHVIDMSLAELLRMADGQDLPEDGLRGIAEDLSGNTQDGMEEYIERALQECMEEGTGRAGYFEMVEEEEEEPVAETPDRDSKASDASFPEGRGMEAGKKTDAFKVLLHCGYSPEQLKILLPLTGICPAERICEIFAPDMDASTMSLMAEILMES